MEEPRIAARALALATDLESAVEEIVALLADIRRGAWSRVPGPGVWSIGKEVEHLAEAAVYHRWIVQMTIGQRVSSRRPPLERSRLTTDRSPHEATDLLRRRTDENAAIIRALTDEQMARPTRPPRARDRTLAEVVERVLIGHYRVHQDSIAAKLRREATG
jgi:uncharacterized damage-inducible protein DinB